MNRKTYKDLIEKLQNQIRADTLELEYYIDRIKEDKKDIQRHTSYNKDFRESIKNNKAMVKKLEKEMKELKDE